MTTALLLGLTVFATCWLFHVVIWRIRRPAAYPIWLPIIFFIYPLSTVLTVGFMCGGLPFGYNTPTIVAACLLHAVIAACYMGGYAGIIEYSPSAEILRVVQANMPNGTPLGSLHVSTLSEEALTGKRIKHLLNSRMIAVENGAVQLTPRGRVVVKICLTYRAAFGLHMEAKG
jgi:hypothetical protein